MPAKDADLQHATEVELDCLRPADVVGVKRVNSLIKMAGGDHFWALCESASMKMEEELVQKHSVRLHLLMCADR